MDRRVALVHDWVVQWGGSEAVVRALADLFPGAPLYLGVWNPDAHGWKAFEGLDVRTTGLQRLLPLVGGDHRRLLPLMPSGFAGLDLSGFDLVISSSHAFSKAVRARSGALHVCYCHTPPRYLWDLYETYSPGWRGALRKPVARWLRGRDVEAARGVDRFVANSKTVADRIRRHYGREARVVHPPVEVERFVGDRAPESFYLAGGRMVAYKRLEVLVEAANRGGFALKVFGEGPERPRLEALAGPTVELVGRLGDAELARLMARCRAFLFAAEDDFGILPVEAQAAGVPVVAWGRGGARETVVHGRTGLLLEDGSPEGFVEGVRALEAREWSPETIRENAVRFERKRFEEEMLEVLGEGNEGRGNEQSVVPARGSA